MLESLTSTLGSSPWTYLAIAVIVAGDAVLPIFPGESAVMTGAVLAADARLSAVVVVVVAVAGALAGDNGTYGLGRIAGRRAAPRLFRGDKGRRRLRWAEARLRRRGAAIIVVARFLPGGRTATTFAAGALDMAWARFLRADAMAAALWGLYATALRYFGGQTFRYALWKPFAASLAVGAVLAAVAELYRRLRLDGAAARGRRLSEHGGD